MNTYLFYTDEGYTVAPNNNKLDSLQILGIEDGKTKDEALIKQFVACVKEEAKERKER